MKMLVLYYNYGGITMRAKRRTEQEQYDIIMECRQSGLSDHQWCLENDINPGTFYNWVRRFRERACELPTSTGKDQFQAVHQEVVKMEIYNTKRIHSHCDYMSPNDYEELYHRLQQDELQMVG